MNATKRKFNTLLQGLSTNPRPTTPENAPATMPTDTPSSIPGSAESLLQKRRRLGLQGAATPNTGLTPAKPSTTNVAVRRWGSHIESKQKGRDDAPAKYSPTDRQDLLRRLSTFQELTDWTPKPERVSEIEWAKRGWVCQGKERVRCVLCHKEVVVKLNRKGADDEEVAVEVGESSLCSHALDVGWLTMSRRSLGGQVRRVDRHITSRGVPVAEARLRWYANSPN